MKTFAKLLLLVVSGYVFYRSLLWLFNSQEMAVIVTISVFLHEVGHAAALLYYGKKTTMVFIPLLGAAVISNKKDRETLMRFSEIVVVLAGPAVNLVLTIFSLFMVVISESGYWMAFASINAGLTAFNLLPIGILDGGRFIKEVFQSASEEKDQTIAVAIRNITFLFGAIMMIMGQFTLYHIMIMWFIRKESNKDDPNEHFSERSLSHEQIDQVLVIYLIMLLFSWSLSVFLPNWIEIYPR